jgi:beta-xylosidase
VAGSEGDFVVVEVSSDLKSWTYLAHGLIVGGQLQFVDPNATGDLGRFYRSRRP